MISSPSSSIITLSRDDARYPAFLREIPHAPEPLYVRGSLSCLSDERCALAIVGTRRGSPEGKRTARESAETLANRGFLIVSGLAFGIDKEAHTGAIASPNGGTIAVLACGLDTPYPREHASLAEHILERGGALISEYPAGTPPLPHYFLDRNRIISGLCIATIVIEAPLRSGAITTARHAVEQGREVFVLPGPVQSPLYEGSHTLIRNGARLVTSTKEIIEDLGTLAVQYPRLLPLLKATAETTGEHLNDPHQKTVFRVLLQSSVPLSLDTIIESTTLEPHMVSEAMTYLVFAGLAEETNGRYNIRSQS